MAYLYFRVSFNKARTEFGREREVKREWEEIEMERIKFGNFLENERQPEGELAL